MKKRSIAALLWIVVFTLGNHTFAQTKDSGSYVVYVGSQIVAEESYTSEKLADGLVKVVSKAAGRAYTTTTKNDKPIELVLGYHSVALTQALTGGGNKNVSLRILPNLTHIFSPISEKSEEAQKISEEFSRTLQNWAFATVVEIPKT